MQTGKCFGHIAPPVGQFLYWTEQLFLLPTVSEYCPRGSLTDILKNDEIKLDNMFVASLVFDIIR